MADPTVVITGANSYLGSNVVRHLLEKTQWRVCALVSPRWQGDPVQASNKRVRYLRVDLTEPLSEPIAFELRSAERICHLAWTRKGSLEEANQLNQKMIDSLMDATLDPFRFCFVSTVAATSGAISDYGKTKFRALRHAQSRGGIVLICGLVIDEPPQGPFRMLTIYARMIPASVRFKNCSAKVYPVHIQDVALAIQKICETRLEGGVYKLFGEGMDLNLFLEKLEQACPRSRIPVVLDCDSVLRWVSFLKRARFAPRQLCEKLQTFLFKEPAELMSYRDIPDMTYRG